MIRLALFLSVAPVFGCALLASESQNTASAASEPILEFVQKPGDSMPVGWQGGPPGSVSLDVEGANDGKPSVRIERTAATTQEFSALRRTIPVDFEGKEIEYKGMIRTDGVSDFAGLWLREDGYSGQLEFNNMQQRQLKGTNDWAEYSIKLPLDATARDLVFGFLVSGTGKAWVSGLQLLVDGKPISEVPRIKQSGSDINLSEITPIQTANLASLCKVWGFLKYHHPKVTAGEMQWDDELFRVMPQILAAPDRSAANDVLTRWIDSLGAIKTTPQNAPHGADTVLRADLSWIDEAVFGRALSERLRSIYLSRPSDGKQFYVSQARYIGNPTFEHELGYPKIKLPDSGYQLLGLFRFWNIVRYWYPYRSLVGEDWNEALSEFIPRIGLAKTPRAYQRELIALIATVRDTHANLWGSLGTRPPDGDGNLPVLIRFVEGRPMVVDVDQSYAAGCPLIKGDIIDGIDGVAVEDLLRKWEPYYAASNEPTRLREIAQSMLQGPVGPVNLRVQRGAQQLVVVANRTAGLRDNFLHKTHELPGATFRLLSKDVAYLKLSSVKVADCESYVAQAEGTKGWIIDARSYPSEFVVFALGSHFVELPTEFVRFTIGNLSNPGEFSFTQPLTLPAKAPHYAGKVIVLVDETTQSQAEYTTMAFSAAPEAIVIGSTTAGADGNVSPIRLPGGLRTLVSGIGIFYPDKRPTQQVGIVPTVEVKPTIAGLRAGRDELIEEAVRRILGPGATADEVMRSGAF